MSKKIFTVLAVLAVLASVSLAVTPAGAKGKKKAKSHPVNTHVLAKSIANGDIAGVVTDPLFGKGATIYSVTTGAGGKQHLNIKEYTDAGSITAVGDVTVGPAAPDGSLPVAGGGQVISGTGAYRGAKGTFTITGSISKDGLVDSKVVGTVKY